jgi:hypothetical protein
MGVKVTFGSWTNTGDRDMSKTVQEERNARWLADRARDQARDRKEKATTPLEQRKANQAEAKVQKDQRHARGPYPTDDVMTEDLTHLNTDEETET